MRFFGATVLFLLCGLLTVVLAQSTDPVQRNDYDPCPTYESCSISSSYTDSQGTTYTWTDCKQDYCAGCDEYGKCEWVNNAGRCDCKDVQRAGAGPNITNCEVEPGSCYVS